jgi:serine protease
MHKRARSTWVVLACVLGLIVFGCQTMRGGGSKIQPTTGTAVQATPEALEEARAEVLRKDRAQRAVWATKTFEEFERSVYKDPFPGGKYIVNGDIAISDRKHLQEFFETSIKREPPQTQPGQLIVQHSGVDAVWNSTQKKQITYCVSTTFGARRASVVSAMQAATGAWSQVADVAYVYVASQDTTCTPSNANVVFDVNPVNVNGQYLARAFFPNEPRAVRNVLIDETAFQLDPNGKLTLIGILRHELGHTLGWRHEHTRPESGTCFEDNEWRPLTSYDSFSVMHYPQCNGAGDWSLTLTNFDKNGAACLYGAAPGFVMDPILVMTPGACQVAGTPTTPSGCGQQQVKTLNDQRVANGEEKSYPAFTVSPGSRFEVKMIGDGTAPGDPDLYIQFGQAPTRTPNGYACRPFASGPSESCALDVPAGKTTAFVMVHGYTAGAYDLTVTYTGP